MARNEARPVQSTGKIKFRVIEFEMEGGNERIEQGLRTLAQAVTRGPEPLQRVISGTRAKPPGLPQNADVEEDVESSNQVDESIAEEEIELSQGSVVAPAKPKPRSAPKAPKFLSALNLTAATLTLESFISDKAPEDTQEKYIVIAEWLKEYLNVEEFTADHIFTAYKHMGWQSQLPPDPGQPLRDLKYKKHWLDAGTAKASFKVNWNGTNAVNKMGITTDK